MPNRSRLALILILIVAAAVDPGMAAVSSAASITQTGFLSASCSNIIEQPTKQSSDGASSWSDSLDLDAATADMNFESQTVDPSQPFVQGTGNAVGVNTGTYSCGASAQYRALIGFSEPTTVVLSGDAQWTDADGDGAVVYLQRYASFDIPARIGGLGSINAGTPIVLDGRYYLYAVAGAPGNADGTAHYNFTLSSSPFPYISIGDETDAEGDSGTTDLTFSVSLSNASTSTVTVDFGTQDDTAQAGTDYEVTSGTVTFAPGEVSKLVTVPVNGDTANEPDETFNVTLSNPVNAVIAIGTGVGTILNDDFPVDFDWTVPDRFDGQDHNGDGLTDYFAPDGPLVIDPSHWEVDFSYSENGACDPGLIQQWRIDGVDIGAGDPHSLAQDPATCSFRYGFADEGKYSVELELRTPGGDLVGTQQHDVVVQDWLIVSIGDSVASGEGNPDAAGGGPSGWENEQCHRSATAGPAQAAADVELADPRTSVTFIHLACSGATIFKGVLGSYDGVIGGSPLPPQLEALRTFVGDREVDAVLMSVGANDAHFSDVLTRCFIQKSCDAERLGTARKRFERDLTRLSSAYDQLGTAMDLMSLDPQRVFVTEYYDPMHSDSGEICADSVLGDLPLLPRLGFSISAEEATWASSTMLPSLNAAVASAATNHGWNYVGGILPQFIPHGYCAVDHWVVRYAESRSQQGDENGTIHPNASGHQVYGNGIAAALNTDFYPTGDLAQPRLPATSTP